MINDVKAGSACLFVKAVLALAFSLSLCFAQEASPKLAVYVSGASGGINKSLSGKLLSAMSQSGNYAEIADPVLFQNELVSSGKDDMTSISQAAKRHGAEYVCVVAMTEALGAHSITARLARVSDLQIVKTGTTDRALRSLDDLTAVSNELARQLLPKGSYAASKEAPADTVAAPAPTGECKEYYNINELLYKVKNGFPAKLKDCSGTLAKDMLTPAAFGGHKLEPKSFLTQCTVDGVKNELPEGFPNSDKIVGSLTNFLQGIMNAALAGGSLDPKKLLSAVASIDIMGLVNDVKKLAADECIVDEPYEPPAAPTGGDDDEKKEKGKSTVSFGIRAGINFSHTYAEYDYGSRSGGGNYGDVLGMQVGFVVDFAVSDLFHIQPGLMYIQKGMKDNCLLAERCNVNSITGHYIELPLLLSFKLDALRLNAGPYLGWRPSSDLSNYGNFVNPYDYFDIGLSTGVGFDIGIFYIGVFYDYGFSNAWNNFNYIARYTFYNRTLGLNLGVNL